MRKKEPEDERMEGDGMTESRTIGGRTVTIHRCGREGAPAVYAPIHSGTGEDVLEACRPLGCPGFDLVSVSGLDWNADLSPWPSDPILTADDGFAGGAGDLMRFLEAEAIPYAEEVLGGCEERIIAGYSMAGLFAIHAPYVTDAFSRCVSASGSLWYPGFIPFVEASRFVRAPSSVYLSVGDREARTRNVMMRTVEYDTRRLAGLYRGMGIDTKFELNPGNHFTDAPIRLAKGIAWTLGRMGR